MKNFFLKKITFTFFVGKVLTVSLLPTNALAQQKPELTVAGIMQHPRWMGTAPTAPYWAEDGSRIFFGYNPDGADADSLYAYAFSTRKISKVSPADRRRLPPAEGVYNLSLIHI